MKISVRISTMQAMRFRINAWCKALQAAIRSGAHTNTCVYVAILSMSVLAVPAAANTNNPFPESALIYLQQGDGNEMSIGQITFTEPVDGKYAYEIDIDTSVFSDHFLSMRPFRCIEGDTEWFCYLPYPYELKRTVSTDDLSDLEYDLLFIKKSPAEFGIDAWNGLYYSLQITEDKQIVGTLLEGDLNSLQSPPENAFDKPIDLNEFLEASDKRLFPTLLIR